jgi:uroporphyrinogen-III decarboxylase
MTENVEKLYAERVARFKKAIKLEQPDRVPIHAMMETWAGFNAGYTLEDMGFNYEKVSNAFSKLFEDFYFDAMNVPLGNRSGHLITALGSNEFSYAVVDGQASLQHNNSENMTPEEYPELIKDPLKFMVEKLIPRRYAEFDLPEPRKSLSLSKGAIQYVNFMSALGQMPKKWKEEYGMPAMFQAAVYMPADIILDYFRGFKGIVSDVRRYRQQLIDACDALVPLCLRNVYLSAQVQDIFPTIFIPLHIPTYLRPKDFEEVYFPSFKKVIDGLIEMGLTPTLFMENTWTPYYDYINELPKGKIIGMIENDDLKIAKEKIGKTICISGNFPLTLLNYGTKEQCIDHAKKLVDDLAPGGGYLFNFDKALLSPNDAKAENLKAVTEFVREYGRYK